LFQLNNAGRLCAALGCAELRRAAVVLKLGYTTLRGFKCNFAAHRFACLRKQSRRRNCASANAILRRGASLARKLSLLQMRRECVYQENQL
jgi:hypothetical protein